MKGGGVINAVADDEVITWSLKKKVGDFVTVADAAGGDVDLMLAGALKTSVFQGYVLIPERDFVSVFGNAGGMRVLLVNCPIGKIKEVVSALPVVLNSAVGVPWGEVSAIFAGIVITAFVFNRYVGKRAGNF